MKETGILFTPDNHRLIRDGKKTQTRRVITPKPEFGNIHDGKYITDPQWIGELFSSVLMPRRDDVLMKCPYGRVGDLMYVKEGIIRHVSIPQLFGYYMDGCRATEPWEKRMTAMFMSKWAARTWLEITGVKAEQIQDISEDDAIAEGISEEWEITGANCNSGVHTEEYGYRYYFPGWGAERYDSAVSAYAALWDSINKKKHPWALNEWVWAIEFKVVRL